MGILTSVEFDRGSPGKFDSRTLNRETLSRWTGRMKNESYVLRFMIIISESNLNDDMSVRSSNDSND